LNLVLLLLNFAWNPGCCEGPTHNIAQANKPGFGSYGKLFAIVSLS